MYNLFIRAYYFAICIASLWNKKAKLWVEGRKDWHRKLSKEIIKGDQYIWMHCSSAGEFEQGRPVAEALKYVYPQYKLLFTFFSPSGYSAAKNYGVADVISYLPLDTKNNARHFYNLVKPKLVIFVKYEFWYHSLSTAASRGVPLLLVSAVFRKEQIFFKKYGGFFRKMLRFFQQIFVQDAPSLQLLKEISVANCSVSGDTRFDRVNEISLRSKPVAFIEAFLQNKKALVAGSTWEDDEVLLKRFMETRPETKLILAPHDVAPGRLQQLASLFPSAVMYSSLLEKQEGTVEAQVLIVDTVGFLSRLYQYATISYVGGGFTKDGIHNVLEAAVWGKPVIFGPNYKKYHEAAGLVEAGGGFSVADARELKLVITGLLANAKTLQTANEKAKAFVKENTGATERIIQAIQEKRLLTKL